jgi:hypothetical protein
MRLGQLDSEHLVFGVIIYKVLVCQATDSPVAET